MPHAAERERRIAEQLAGQHVLLTGVTGFVGEALLELLLAEAPDTTLTLLVRPKGSSRGTDRVSALLAKAIFSETVERAGGVDALLAGRVRVLEGDLADVPELPDDLDAVVHCAGDVSFDPPVDEGFRTNVVGTRDLLERVRAVGPHVHYVHISTAYVAGRRRGAIAEGPSTTTSTSRRSWPGGWPSGASSSTPRAPPTCSPAAGPAPSASTAAPACSPLPRRPRTTARRGWRASSSASAPSGRAASAGPTATRSPRRWASGSSRSTPPTAPVSIVRPSIIESALERPHPGWIEGFKMAEPLILAYGRGELPEFPAAGDTIVDIVPVDHVVAAIVAVLAQPAGARCRGVLPRLLGRPQPADVPAPLRERARLLRRAPVRRRRPRRGPAARLAVPRCADRRAAALHQRARPQGGRLPGRARAARRPRAGPRAQARPAGPAAGVPAPLPRPVPRVRRGRAALRRPAHPRVCSRGWTPTTARRSASTPPTSTGTTTCARCTARR